jgi:3-hydroxyacyl-CoA dehydrogenase/enoyl-CoA hydratase/3-hydroxybutyryl-CoA epimerase
MGGSTREDPFSLTVVDGVATLRWDMPGRTHNLLDERTIADLETLVERIAADEAIAGCIVLSGKEGFSAGADIGLIKGLIALHRRESSAFGPGEALIRLRGRASRLSALFRRIETCGKPFVALIHGLCLGGGFEFALACHHRIAADEAATRLGLPEIKIGIFPGAGGTTRLARRLPLPEALRLLLRGETIGAEEALRLGLVEAIAPRAGIIEAAKAALARGVAALAPWDSGRAQGLAAKVHSAGGVQTLAGASALLMRETQDLLPAARACLQCVYEGLQIPFDAALGIEAAHFAEVLAGREAEAMIDTLFIAKGAIERGARRPAAEARPARRLGVVGGGFMGAGIALLAARAGLDVVVVERDEAGVEASRRRIAEGARKAGSDEGAAARIRVATDVAALADADAVIEAVVEDRGVKAGVLAALSAVVGPTALVATNTSTLPIGSLAATVAGPERFVGMHFFSPVARMPLCELIRGPASADDAIARAFDLARILRKTPIVVRDARGFFANRCVLAFLAEGHRMLIEGLPPAMIENLARAAGMPLGPLALSDEVGLDLGLAILRATRADLGEGAVDPRQFALLEALVVREGRLGRKNGKGFHDHGEDGRRLWPGLARLADRPVPPEAVDRDEVRQRFLAIQALEAARAVFDGIVEDPREADLGSILGFGFPAHTGGALSYIDGMGADAFVGLCEWLARGHGARFRPPAPLRAMAESGGRFADLSAASTDARATTLA